MVMQTGIYQALLAAVLFGASTPLAKSLVGTTSAYARTPRSWATR